MSLIPRPYEIYKHFKGNLYQIVAIAEHSENGEKMVVYQALYGDFKIYVRPLEMFLSPVDREKYPQATQRLRFERQAVEASASASGYAIQQTSEGILGKTVEMENLQADQEEELQIAPSEELQIDPMVLEFLDADSYEMRLNILTGLQHRVTDEMITTMAIACDVEVGEGSTEERFASLKNCLLTLERYECNRIR